MINETALNFCLMSEIAFLTSSMSLFIVEIPLFDYSVFLLRFLLVVNCFLSSWSIFNLYFVLYFTDKKFGTHVRKVLFCILHFSQGCFLCDLLMPFSQQESVYTNAAFVLMLFQLCSRLPWFWLLIVVSSVLTATFSTLRLVQHCQICSCFHH